MGCQFTAACQTVTHTALPAPKLSRELVDARTIITAFVLPADLLGKGSTFTAALALTLGLAGSSLTCMKQLKVSAARKICFIQFAVVFPTLPYAGSNTVTQLAIVNRHDTAQPHFSQFSGVSFLVMSGAREAFCPGIRGSLQRSRLLMYSEGLSLLRVSPFHPLFTMKPRMFYPFTNECMLPYLVPFSLIKALFVVPLELLFPAAQPRPFSSSSAGVDIYSKNFPPLNFDQI